MPGHVETGSPLDILWQPRAIAAVLLSGEGLALLLALAPGGQVDRWTYFGIASLVIQWVSLLTLTGLYLLRRRLSRLPPLTLAWVALALWLLATGLVGVCASLAWPAPMMGAQSGHWPDPWQLGLLSLTVGMLGLAAFHGHWRNRSLAARAAQAELESLQARTRPHFLFNTLNTGAALVHERPEAAERLLLDLADLFRAALGGAQQIPLREEIDLVRRYLDIEQMRFGERLRVHWRLPEPLPETMVPLLGLQPLVENAIRHGVEPLPEGGELAIDVEVQRDTLVVGICNPLPPPGRRPVAGHSVGLASVRARINALTAGEGLLQTRVTAGLFCVEVRLPMTPPDGRQGTGAVRAGQPPITR